MIEDEPFQLTEEDIRTARLSESDLGVWCILEQGCYHLFANEDGARQAHQMMRVGKYVR